MNRTYAGRLSTICPVFQRPAWRDSDLGRLAERAANWLNYDQELVELCREALRLGFTKLENGKRTVYCAGYLQGERCTREAWETFWEGR